MQELQEEIAKVSRAGRGGDRRLQSPGDTWLLPSLLAAQRGAGSWLSTD